MLPREVGRTVLKERAEGFADPVGRLVIVDPEGEGQGAVRLGGAVAQAMEAALLRNDAGATANKKSRAWCCRCRSTRAAATAIAAVDACSHAAGRMEGVG